MPSSPRSVLDWYRDARLVLDQCEVETERMSRAGVRLTAGISPRRYGCPSNSLPWSNDRAPGRPHE